ncbi:type ISP restriction/modification enzyme [Bradyrhizobium sp. LjRoot220]|uniref:type ISP restriction/modification enzyme n=1 Tax=Bradyrhizobium sp. LjRoot220 TaxID=3342284 RepID=UPI003F4F55E8
MIVNGSPDPRLINRPDPTLWNSYSARQVYLIGLERHSPTSGPAITFAGHIPNHDHYKSRCWPSAAALERSNRDATQHQASVTTQFGENTASR